MRKEALVILSKKLSNCFKESALCKVSNGRMVGTLQYPSEKFLKTRIFFFKCHIKKLKVFINSASYNLYIYYKNVSFLEEIIWRNKLDLEKETSF